MHRILERLDAAASTLVPLAYLAALAIGTAAYFTGVTLDAGIAVGASLAIAAELHAFLTQRRTRALWGAYSRAEEGPARSSLFTPLRAQFAILCVLTAFSTYNSLAFVVATFHPVPGFLPGWIQIAIRGSVVPAFFLLAGFLSPLHTDAAEVLASAASEMTHYTIRRVVKQWRVRIRRAAGPSWWQVWRVGERGIDLAPVAVALFHDAGDADGARRIQLIASGLDTAEGRTGAPALPAPKSVFVPSVAAALAPAPLSEHSDGGEGDETPPPPPASPPTGPERPRKRQEPALRLVSERSTSHRADAGRVTEDARIRWARHVEAARVLLAEEPKLTTRKLGEKMAAKLDENITNNRATEVRRWIREQAKEVTEPAATA